MSLKASLKARTAAAKLSKGDAEGAMKDYEEAVQEGLTDARSLLNYSVLLIRKGEFQKARELLVKMQKYPMNEENRRLLFVNYASCVYKMGELEKGIELLERLHQKQPSGLVYQTLGYLYVEAGDLDKALAFNQQALEYDDEDPIVLDNMGQTYYRLANDPDKARPYFEKAHELKPAQIDTLYFLSQYDISDGKKEAAKEKLETALNGRFSPLNYATRDMVQQTLDGLGA